MEGVTPEAISVLRPGGRLSATADAAPFPPTCSGPEPFGPLVWPSADGPHPIRATWPLRGTHLRRWCYAYLALAAVTTALGFVVVVLVENTALGALDADVARRLAAARTPDRTTWAHWAGNLGDGTTIVPLVALSAGLFVWRWRRWQESAVLIGALVLEKSVFLTATFAIRRPRPSVPHLDGEPMTFSYPSGHVAASMVTYGVLGLVLLWHLGRGPRSLTGTIARIVAALLAGLVPAAVAVGRLYLGMHYVTDVVAGALLGGAAVLVVVAVVRDGSRARWQDRAASLPVPLRRAG